MKEVEQLAAQLPTSDASAKELAQIQRRRPIGAADPEDRRGDLDVGGSWSRPSSRAITRTALTSAARKPSP